MYSPSGSPCFLPALTSAWVTLIVSGSLRSPDGHGPSPDGRLRSIFARSALGLPGVGHQRVNRLPEAHADPKPPPLPEVVGPLARTTRSRYSYTCNRTRSPGIKGGLHERSLPRAGGARPG